MATLWEFDLPHSQNTGTYYVPMYMFEINLQTYKSKVELEIKAVKKGA